MKRQFGLHVTALVIMGIGLFATQIMCRRGLVVDDVVTLFLVMVTMNVLRLAVAVVATAVAAMAVLIARLGVPMAAAMLVLFAILRFLQAILLFGNRVFARATEPTLRHANVTAAFSKPAGKLCTLAVDTLLELGLLFGASAPQV